MTCVCRPHTRESPARRASGYLLVELLVTLVLLTVGLFGFFFVFYTNFGSAEQMDDVDDVRLALESVRERLRGAPFGEVYTKFHGQSLAAPGLRGPEGQTARVLVTCFVNELKIPREFGPVTDLDGDGELATTDCSTGYQLLPTLLRLTFVAADGAVETRELHVVLSALGG